MIPLQFVVFRKNTLADIDMDKDDMEASTPSME
jgi:hypothetical protein